MPSDGSAEARAAWAAAAVGAVLFYIFRRPSENFTWDELTTTNTGLPNDPPLPARFQLLLLAREILQPLRGEFGPIRITSAYRSPAVNGQVNGAGGVCERSSRNTKCSRHTNGSAADLYSQATHEEMATWLYNQDLPLAEVIVERHTGHLHLARRTSGDKPAAFLQTSDGKSYTSWMPPYPRILS